MGFLEPHSTVLSVEQEAMIVAFRRHSLLPLPSRRLLSNHLPGNGRLPLCSAADDLRSDAILLASVFGKRHGISRLPYMDDDAPAKRKFKSYPIGFFHIDIAYVRSDEGKLYMFVAIDRNQNLPLLGSMNRRTGPKP
jgi:hypothetical protein